MCAAMCSRVPMRPALRIAGVEPALAQAHAVTARPVRARPARVYLLGADGKPRAYTLRVGVSDGAFSELLLQAGTPAAQAWWRARR